MASPPEAPPPVDADPSASGAETPPTRPGMENNPGTYEEMHRKCKELQPVCFDGAQLIVAKGLSSHFQITHKVTLSPVQSGYRFMSTYVGSKQYCPSESYPVFLGDTDLTGNTMATAIHQFTDRWRGKVQAQVQQAKLAVCQLTGEYTAPAYTATLGVVNPDLVNDSGVMVLQYLRRVHSKLDLGAELIHQQGRSVPGGQVSTLSCAARYLFSNGIFAGTLGSSALHLSYVHRQSKNLSFGVEWETSARTAESVATFAYNVTMPEANVEFSASIDSNSTVSAALEKRLHPIPARLMLSGQLNHTSGRSRFGIGLQIGN